MITEFERFDLHLHPTPRHEQHRFEFDPPVRNQDQWLQCEGDIAEDIACDDSGIVESAAPLLPRRAAYIGTPKYRPCRTTVEDFCHKHGNSFVRKVFSKGAFCNLTVRSSKGRPIQLNYEDRTQVELHISALLTAGLICVSRRTAFISYPFVVPKASGESRLIVDFSHLRGKYKKPELMMPAFPAVLRCWHPVVRGDYMARIDIQAAFYNVPLPPRLSKVTAFRYNNKTYRFNVLPMGLYISPAILQAAVQFALRTVVPGPHRQDGKFGWTHLDDILLAADSKIKLHNMVADVIRALNDWGFYVAIKKSELLGTQCLNYCGIQINTQRDTFAVATSRLAFFKQLLVSPSRFTASAWGYLAYWLFALGLSSVSRLLLRSHAAMLIKILESGPWPLPRPPERVWATDASAEFLTVVAPTQLVFKGPAFAKTIFENELLALFVAAFFAPMNTLIMCDNTAVIGATARRSSRPSWISIATTILRAKKNLQYLYIPSKLNPADHPSRCIDNSCQLAVCDHQHAVSVYLERDWPGMTHTVIQ